MLQTDLTRGETPCFDYLLWQSCSLQAARFMVLMDQKWSLLQVPNLTFLGQLEARRRELHCKGCKENCAAVEAPIAMSSWEHLMRADISQPYPKGWWGYGHRGCGASSFLYLSFLNLCWCEQRVTVAGNLPWQGRSKDDSHQKYSGQLRAPMRRGEERRRRRSAEGVEVLHEQADLDR